ncbi:MAG: DUF721 domain-containing protein [Proteobacteria bacterium]|nr:DUF721 domain-containing protein [Pseudomonadota bacterium]
MSTQAEKPKKKVEADRRNSLSALASNVPALTKLALGRKGFAEASLIGEWAVIVGADIARLCIPVKMRLPRAKKDEQPAAGSVPANVAGGTLTLRASPSASLEVQHLKPRILERIQRYFGYPLIHEIKIEIGDRKRPAKPRRPLLATTGQPDLSRVKDPDIRAALERLGAARAKRR